MILGVLVVPLWPSRHSLRQLLARAVQIAAGVVCMSLILMLISRLLFHEWDCFDPQMGVLRYCRDHPGLWRQEWGTEPYLAGAKRLFLPAFVLFFGAAFMWVIRRSSLAFVPLYLGTVVCLGIYCIQESR
jgi:hypothetical protein